MATLTDEQIAALWVNAGGPLSQAPLMTAIALAESSGNTDAHNPSGASGLWQILGAPTNWSGSQDWFNPGVNARAAVAKYRQQGLGAWQAYTSGAYQQYMSQANAAVQQMRTKGSQHPGGLGAYIGGIIGTIVGGAGAGTPIGAAIGGAGASGLAQLTLPQSVISFFDQAENIVSGAMWLLNPVHWARIVSGIAGVILVGLGLGLFMRAAV